MKKLILAFIVAFCAQVMFAQAVRESVEPFDKVRQPAFSITLEYPKKTVEEALDNRLKQDKLKGKSTKGMTLYSQVLYPTISDSKIDLYTKVVGNAKTTTVYLFISKGYENFISSGDDPSTGAKANEFLKTVIIDVRNLAHKQDIADQEGIVDKATKERDKLLKDQEKLIQQQKDLEKSILQSEESLKTQQGILDNLRSKQPERY